MSSDSRLLLVSLIAGLLVYCSNRVASQSQAADNSSSSADVTAAVTSIAQVDTSSTLTTSTSTTTATTTTTTTASTTASLTSTQSTTSQGSTLPPTCGQTDTHLWTSQCSSIPGIKINTTITFCEPANITDCPAVRWCNTTADISKFFGLMCASDGIKIYECKGTYVPTTPTLCGQLGSAPFTCNTNGNNYGLNASSVTAFIFKKNNCSAPVTATTASSLKLLPNPVGPEAITAIVVLVCLTITAILAGFFFWPKCHIADPAAEALKKITKPASAKSAAAAYTVTAEASASSSSTDKNSKVVYDGGQKTATIKLPLAPGPSAA